MWTPIKLTDQATGRSVHITIMEREMYLSGFFSFEDLWAIHQPLTGFEWSIADLLSVRPDLTAEQAEEVLKSAAENSGADTCLMGDVLEMWAESLYPKNNDNGGEAND